MLETGIVLGVGLPVLLLLGVPFAIALGLTALGGLIVSDIDTLVLAQRFVSGTQSFSLLAVPFFVLAGELMTHGGLSRRLVGVADTFVRHRTGGLGLVMVVSATFFAAISGSAPATTAAVGTILIPEMEKKGYERAFAAALAVAAGIIGPIIPPSITFIIWGVLAQESIVRLFAAGIIPGILMAIGLMVLSVRYARKNKIVKDVKATTSERFSAIRKGKWALLAPVIVLGGIYGGVVTPTEAGVVAVVYSLLVGMVIYKELKLSDLPEIILSSIKTSAMVLFIIAAASSFGWLIALEQYPPQIASLLNNFSDKPWLILLILNVSLLLIGATMDIVAAMIILSGVLVAIGEQLGMNGIQLGAMVATNFVIGMATPPFGYALFVGAAVSGCSIGQISRHLMPLIGVLLVVLALITFVPATTLFIQRFI
jgi:C4-dicarboxylate transporter DctM subunit